MKVVHVVRQFHPSVGGMEEVVLNVARHHQAAGNDEVEVVTLDRVFSQPELRLASTAQHGTLPVRRLSWRGSSRYPLTPAVLRAISSADVVHVHGIDFFYDYLALTTLLHRKPMIVSTHGGFFHTAYASKLKKLWFNTLTRASALAYKRVVATSENDGDMFSQVVSPQRLRVIENGVDVTKFADKGSPTNGRTLIYFGRWSVNKGLLETLDLFAALRERNASWQLIVAGREYDLTRADLEREIAARGLQGAVEIVVSPSETELGTLLGKAQYFVCLSRHEGFGIAPVEAMSAGLVPVLSQIPPFMRLHRESDLGVIVDPRNPAAGAEAAEQQATVSEQEYTARRTRAMAYVARYDWKHVVGRYVAEYHAALGMEGAS
ncbi:alpha-1,3-mannosyltransferase [Pseudoxanthomonas sp. GM95]|uniref:glycosyltransferase family 4 protein n=1 Tax=Pseudoxanthomonas sp. GM95 TaxID=1881043 RepID=UPI0008CD9468|nr:glycosyltransferase family 4 protein [Pseudoxanthomonas sp. GM95]SEK80522.1 alpha-1,3-mannosyltransferase [Pseudoxanthomonas sp. GM95]